MYAQECATAVHVHVEQDLVWTQKPGSMVAVKKKKKKKKEEEEEDEDEAMEGRGSAECANYMSEYARLEAR